MSLGLPVPSTGIELPSPCASTGRWTLALTHHTAVKHMRPFHTINTEFQKQAILMGTTFSVCTVILDWLYFFKIMGTSLYRCLILAGFVN